MAIDRESQTIEDLLDKGLRKYGDVVPRPGLETRVLAQLRSEGETVAVGFWQRWSVRLGAMVVGAALALMIVWKPSAKAPEVPRAVSRAELQARNVLTPTPRAGGSRQELSPKARRRVVPVVVARRQPQQFPSTRPLSSQEQLLLAYVNQAPFEEVAATARQARRIEELHVQDLEVAPLDVDRPGTVTEQK